MQACVGARSLVVSRGGGVLLLPLTAALKHDAAAAELGAFPGPLVRALSHKSRVLQYCTARADAAARAAGVDPLGRALVYQLLALLLRQNGVCVHAHPHTCTTTDV